MSQAGSLAGTITAAGIAFVEGNNGGANRIHGDGVGQINIVGDGVTVTTTGNAASTLTISALAHIGQIETDDIAFFGPIVPNAGVISILGTANQIKTSAPPAGGPYHTVEISLEDDVEINGTLDVGDSLIVATDITCRDIGSRNVTTTGFINCIGGLTTHSGITNTGDIESTGALTIHGIHFPMGVMQIDHLGEVYSNTGADGFLLIGNSQVDVNPAWSALGTDGSIVITPGHSSLILSTGDNVATLFRAEDATVTGPILKTITITGDANIRSTAAAGVVTMSLSPNVTISGAFQAATVTSTGLMTAQNTLTISAGNLTVTAGNINVAAGTITSSGAINVTGGGITATGIIRSNNAAGGFISTATAGNLALDTTNGNINTTNGTVTGNTLRGAHLVATTDLTLPVTALPGVLIKSAGGLVNSTSSTNGQVLMADTLNGTAFGNIAQGAGINIGYSTPGGVRTLTITNTGAGGVKAAFEAQLNTNVTGIAADGVTIYLVRGPWLNKMHDLTDSFDCTITPATFTAPATGFYRFSIQFACHTAPTSVLRLTFLTHIYTTPRTYTVQRNTYQPVTNSVGGDVTFQQSNDVYLTAGQTAYFGIQGGTTGGAPALQYSLLATQTFITGFQIS
jgi:hypothetical protein